MIRSCSAALVVLCGLASTAQAQYTGYYHAPPYGTYANYAPAGFNGPLRVADWRWWAGVAPYSPAYSYSGAAYTAGYAPTAYTAGYAPSAYTTGYAPSAYVGYTTTTNYLTPGYAAASYYGPSYDAAIAYYPSPYVAAPGACCNPCGGGAAYGNPACPGGNCGMNYQPTPVENPQPDASSKPVPSTSGSQTYENQSEPAPGTGVVPNAANPMETDPMGGGAGEPAPGSDDWREPFDRGNGVEPAPAEDGFAPTERGANYSPPETIQKKAPIEGAGSSSELPGIDDPVAPESPEAGADPAADDEEPEASIFFKPIIPDPEAARPLVNRDSRISNAPSVLPERRRLSARFGSPELARSKANPENIPSAKDLKLVRK